MSKIDDSNLYVGVNRTVDSLMASTDANISGFQNSLSGLYIVLDLSACNPHMYSYSHTSISMFKHFS